MSDDNLGFLVCAVTADTRAKALEAGRHCVWRMGPTLRDPVEYFLPVGMPSSAANQFALKARSVSLSKMSYGELVCLGLWGAHHGSVKPCLPPWSD